MELSIEEMIETKGLTAPRVRKEDLQAEIVKAEYHQFEGSTVTVCCLYLRNGFTVVGHSACADPANFDPEIGRKIARDHATEQMWPLLGFRLRDQLYLAQHPPAYPEPLLVEVMGEDLPETMTDADPGPYKSVELGDQVFYFEQLEGKVTEPMIATVSSVLGNGNVSLTVSAPNGTVHARENIELVYPWTPASTAMSFARPK